MRELDLLGVYVSPFLRDLAIAALAFAPVKVGLDHLAVDRYVWHRPLFDLALFACFVAVATFAFTRASGF